MREIKFRSWYLDTKMVYSDDMVAENKLGSFFERYVDSDNVMQFTGIKDRNGKEIYEGDILEAEAPDNDETKKRFVVEFKDGAYQIEWDSMFYEDSDITTIYWAEELGFSFEVIGNIHQNPELLVSRSS